MKVLVIILFFSTLQCFAQFTGAGSSSGSGNPASVFCIKNGGKVSIQSSPEGEYGVCQIEEWTLFNLFIDREIDLPNNSKNPGFGNPASKLCQSLNGETLILDSPNGQIGFCLIEEWTLFRIFL